MGSSSQTRALTHRGPTDLNSSNKRDIEKLQQQSQIQRGGIRKNAKVSATRWRATFLSRCSRQKAFHSPRLPLRRHGSTVPSDDEMLESLHLGARPTSGAQQHPMEQPRECFFAEFALLRESLLVWHPWPQPCLRSWQRSSRLCRGAAPQAKALPPRGGNCQPLWRGPVRRRAGAEGQCCGEQPLLFATHRTTPISHRSVTVP